jgi:hypothetical protein
MNMYHAHISFAILANIVVYCYTLAFAPEIECLLLALLKSTHFDIRKHSRKHSRKNQRENQRKNQNCHKTSAGI